MKRYISTIILVIIIPLIFSSNSFALKKEIVWLTADFPPYVILSGPYKGQGITDFMQKLVMDSLDDYKHTTVVANPKRIFHELKNSDMVAYASALKSRERERYTVFSIPLFVLPSAAIVKKSKFNSLKPYMRNGQLLLDRVIAESNLQLGLPVGRIYGGAIDKILRKYRKHKNINIYYENPFKRTMKELLNKNLDYTIGYSAEATYFLRNEKKAESIVSIPVDGMYKYISAYFAFPKTKWGKMILKRVNPVLRKHRISRAVHKSYEFWLDDMGKKQFRKYAKEFYGDEFPEVD